MAETLNQETPQVPRTGRGGGGRKRALPVSTTLGSIWIVSVALLADGFAHETWQLFHQPLNLYLLVAAGAVVVYAAALAGLARATRGMESKQLWRTGLIIVLVGFALRLVWVVAFDSYQMSDYGDYLTCGREIVEGTIGRCPTPVHWRRGLTVAAPVIALFGLKLEAIEGANLVLYLASSGLFLVLVQHLAGLRWAVLGLAFFVVAPELFYPVTLASHDIHGIFWLLVFLVLAYHMSEVVGDEVLSWRPLAILVALSVGLGVSLAGLQLSRSYGTPAALALVAWTVFLAARIRARAPGRARRIFLLLGLALGLPLAVSGGIQEQLSRAFPPPPPVPAYSTVAWVTGVNIRTPNTHPDRVVWKKAEFPLLVKAGRVDFAWAKLGNEWSHDLTVSFKHLLRKNHFLSMSGGNRIGASAPRPASDERDPTVNQVGRTNNRGFQLQDRMIRLLNLLLIGLMLGRLLLVRWIPFRPSELLLLAFCSLMYLVLLLFMETQQRYDIFLLIPGSYMAAQFLVWFLEERDAPGPSLRSGPWFPVLSGASAVLVLGFLGAVGLKGYAATRHTFADMGTTRGMTPDELSRLLPQASPVAARLDVAFNRGGVGFPRISGGVPRGSAAGLALDLPLSAGRSSGDPRLEGFFVVAPGLLTHREDLVGLPLQACLYIESVEVECTTPDTTRARFLQRPAEDVDRDGLLEIRLVVKTLAHLDERRVPTQPVALLEHLRLR